MLSFLLAGGAFLGAVTQTTSTTTEVDMYNHTLRGERILAREVVCRSRWGTPMLPDGKGGYSLIAPINEEFIRRSLIQPPKPLPPFLDVRPKDVVFRPTTTVTVTETITTTVPVAPAR